MPTERSSAANEVHRSHTIIVKSGGRQWTLQSVRDVVPSVGRDQPVRRPKMPSPLDHSLDSKPFLSPKPSMLRNAFEAFVAWLDRTLVHRPEESARTETRVNQLSVRKWRSMTAVCLKESFGWGAVLGMLLGCLCIVGIHAIHDGPVLLSKPVIAKPTAPAALVSSGPPITVPAVRLYGLYVAPEGTGRLSTSKLRLWRVAAYSSDLLQYKTEVPFGMSHPIWRIMPLQWNIRAVRTLPTTARGTSTRVSTWLASEVSALNALASSIADGEPGRDAWTAYETAKTVAPQSSYLNATGQATALRKFDAAVQTAFEAYAHGRLPTAAALVSSAYQTVEHLH